MLVFFFKQKTAYVMRISDWSSDVCSSDLNAGERRFRILQQPQPLLQRRGARRRQTLDQRSGQIGIARRQRLARALFERGIADQVLRLQPVEWRIAGRWALRSDRAEGEQRTEQKVGRAAGREKGGEYGGVNGE